jgi:hypothetical protein
MAHWDDMGWEFYMLTVRDIEGIGMEKLACLTVVGTVWRLWVTNCGRSSVPVAGRTLNEIKEDAESWLKENGYQIVDGEKK